MWMPQTNNNFASLQNHDFTDLFNIRYKASWGWWQRSASFEVQLWDHICKHIQYLKNPIAANKTNLLGSNLF